MADIHEPFELLTQETIDLHRAVNSVKEELDAIDWYQQRVDATTDEALKRVLGHNRDEEIEHACMVLEWIRRRHAGFDAALRTYLFSQGDLTTLEQAADREGGGGAQAPAVPAPPALGSLKGGG